MSHIIIAVGTPKRYAVVARPYTLQKICPEFSGRHPYFRVQSSVMDPIGSGAVKYLEWVMDDRLDESRLRKEDLGLIAMNAYLCGHRDVDMHPAVPALQTRIGTVHSHVPKRLSCLLANVGSAFLANLPLNIAPGGVQQLFQYALEGKDEKWCRGEAMMALRQKDESIDGIIEKDLTKRVIPFPVWESWTLKRHFPHAYKGDGE